MRKRKITGILLALLTLIMLLTGCAQVKELTENTAQNRQTEAAAATAGKDTGEQKAAPAEEATDAPERKTTPAEKATDAPEREAPPTETARETGPITEPQEIADYLFAHGTLPDNFITKSEAQALGWDSSRNYISDVAPGKSIGGDRFGNYEGRLPKVKGRKYYEADCRYTGGKRGAERIIWSSDGHVWYTKDHYQTFTELFPSGQEE